MRTIREIASDIYGDWNNPSLSTSLYLRDMMKVDTLNDMCGCNSGFDLVSFFLIGCCNYNTKKSKVLKQELKDILKASVYTI